MPPVSITNPITFQSYPEFCAALNVPVKTGRGKQNQLKELSKFVSITTVGQKITIAEKQFSSSENQAASLEIESITMDSSNLSTGSGVFADRKILFMRMLWERIKEAQEESILFPANPTSFSPHPEDSKHTLIFYPEEVAIALHLIQENFLEAKAVAREIGVPDLLWSLNEISAQNKRVITTLFSNLYSSPLIAGFKTYRIEWISGGDLICTSEDSLLITEVIEHLLKELDCKNIYEVYLKNKEKDYYSELSSRLRRLYGIAFFEECYVVITSEFLLSRFMVKYFSKASQKLILTKQSNEGNIKSLGKRINREVGRMYLAASGHELCGDTEKAQSIRRSADRREQIFHRTVGIVVADKVD
jgi:hypothetical protein